MALSFFQTTASTTLPPPPSPGRTLLLAGADWGGGGAEGLGRQPGSGRPDQPGKTVLAGGFGGMQVHHLPARAHAQQSREKDYPAMLTALALIWVRQPPCLVASLLSSLLFWDSQFMSCQCCSFSLCSKGLICSA